MRESKAELTDRLRREGRWEDFKKMRDELRSTGIPAKQAWYQAAVEFPSTVRHALSSVSAPSPDDVEALKTKPSISTMDAARWVFDHLDGDWIKPADAPSAGAWSLREWARTNTATRTEFYRMFGIKLLTPAQEKYERYEDDGRDLTKLLTKLEKGPWRVQDSGEPQSAGIT